MYTSYQIGFMVAWAEIDARIASYVEAKERGLYRGDQDSRLEWDRGYADAVCAYRLGHDVRAMVEAEFFGPSLTSTADLVGRLLDGTWPEFREDPRCHPENLTRPAEGG